MKTRTKSRRAQGGYAAIMTTLMLLPLLGFAGLAADVGFWYDRAAEVQKAADAAALAGVVHLPDVGLATTKANEAAKRNGFDPADADIDVNVSNNGTDNELTVEITDNGVPLFFADLFLDDIVISRQAVAELNKNLPMGSPDSFLGNDPLRTGDDYLPNYWLVIFGGDTTKRSGDRYHTRVCGTAIFCTGNSNDEFEENGYIFEAPVTALQPGQSLTFEAFDPAFHNYQDRCTQGYLLDEGEEFTFDVADNVTSSPAWYDSADPAYDADLGSYPAERYLSGNDRANAWCPGDNGNDNGDTLRTTFLVREPDLTPLNPYDNNVICSMQFGETIPSDEADFESRLLDTVTLDQPIGAGVPTLAFRDYFRNWVQVCEDTTPVVGTYIIQIRTNADLSASPGSWVAADNTQAAHGRNRFSMRTGFGDPDINPNYATGVSLAAPNRLPIFVNYGQSDTEFTLVQIQPEVAGRYIQLDFYDLTDGSTLDVSIVPPDEATDGGVALDVFTNCQYTLVEPGGETSLSVTDCGTNLAAGRSNGDAIVGLVQIPNGYDCDTTSDTGCWVKVLMEFAGDPNDTTTWSAAVIGDPLRLVE